MTDPNCVFCKIIAGETPAARIFEDRQTLAFLDISPFEPGHLLVVPRRHVERYTELPLSELEPLARAVQHVARLLMERLPCDGFNLAQNNGACANQIVPHLHFHVVPRWNGKRVNWTPGRYACPEDMEQIVQRLTASA